MARRRMVNVELVESDKFVDMSTSAQLFYFHLCMRADDDGFIDNLKSLQRYYGIKEKVVDELEEFGFIIKFSKITFIILIKIETTKGDKNPFKEKYFPNIKSTANSMIILITK